MLQYSSSRRHLSNVCGVTTSMSTNQKRKMLSHVFVLLCACTIGEIIGNKFNTNQRTKRSDLYADVYWETNPKPHHPSEHNDPFRVGPNSNANEYDEYGAFGGDASNSKLDELTLDDILSSSKGQEIILKEAQRRINLRMSKVIDQVSEEIVESLEGDAGAAMVAEKEDSNHAQSFNKNIISTCFYTVVFTWIQQTSFQ